MNRDYCNPGKHYLDEMRAQDRGELVACRFLIEDFVIMGINRVSDCRGRLIYDRRKDKKNESGG